MHYYNRTYIHGKEQLPNATSSHEWMDSLQCCNWNSAVHRFLFIIRLRCDFKNSAEYWYFKKADHHTQSPNTKQILDKKIVKL